VNTTRLSGLSIVVPAYNEERTVEKVLSDLLGLKVDFPLEIILVDDGSTDGTRKKIRKYIQIRD
jgi:glycosyltransferase involved in cell wall biosynthesis